MHDNIINILPQKYEPDLSDSPLPNDERQALVNKIKQMHCQGCFQRGYRTLIPLDSFLFTEVCTSDKVRLLTLTRNTPEEVLQDLQEKAPNLTDTYSDFLLNIITGNEPSLEVLTRLTEYFKNTRHVWGICIDKQASTNYRIELIAYNSITP